MLLTPNNLKSPSDIKLPQAQGFLVLEGLNGAGKSTLQKAIGKFLLDRKLEVLLTREPGGSVLGQKIRSLVLEGTSHRSALAELFLFAADRAEHVEHVIQPALKEKKLVICDRYYYSTLAFQGDGRGLDQATVEQVTLCAINHQFPDLVILLDLPPEAGLKRTKKRSEQSSVIEKDNFEEQEIEFHQRLRSSFLRIARESIEPFIVVDAMQGPEEIFEELKPVLTAWIEQCLQHKSKL